MKKFIAVFLVCLTVIALIPAHRDAYAGGPLPFATEITQVLNYGQLITSTAQQAQQVAMQVQQLARQLQDGQIQPNQIFATVNGDITQMANTVQVGQAMSYSLSNLDTEFQNRFPGYGATTSTNYSQLYKNWSQTSYDTTRSAVAAISQHASDLQSGSAMVQQLQQQANSTTGVLQALQVLGEIASQQVVEMQKLRALMLSDMQSKETFQQQQIQSHQSMQDLTTNWFQAVSTDNSDQTLF
jgi:P-type conjugative transfer protein TrbJ